MTQDLLAKLGLDLSTDPRWLVIETGFSSVREHEVETLLTIGNGYLGTRGSLEENPAIGKPSTLIAGYFDPKEGGTDVPALVIGNKAARDEFTRGMKDLTDIAPAIWKTVMG